MTRRVGKCGRTLRPQPRPQGFYQCVHAAATGLRLNLTHSEASSSDTSAASRHGLAVPCQPGDRLQMGFSLLSTRWLCCTGQGHSGRAFVLTYDKTVSHSLQSFPRVNIRCSGNIQGRFSSTAEALLFRFQMVTCRIVCRLVMNMSRFPDIYLCLSHFSRTF